MCTNTVSCNTNQKEVCDYTASPPQNKCVYDGPCKKTPPSCDPDQVAVCGSDNQWSCASAPVNIDVVVSQYGLKAYPANDLTGTCKNGPGGTCVVYAKEADSSVFSPVAPTRGVYNMTSGNACDWTLPMNTDGSVDQNAITLLNNPPYNLVWQGRTLTVVDVTKDSKYVSYVKSAASPSVPFDQVCYVPNSCDPSSTKVALDASHNLVCTCDSNHYGPNCNFTEAQCSKVGVPTVGTTCTNCGAAQEGQFSLCECTGAQGGWGVSAQTVTSCTCHTDPTKKPLYAGPTCQYSRAIDCNANGTPYYNANGTHGCICDPHFAGPSCLLSRDTCNNRGDPTYTGGLAGCICDPTDPDKPAGPSCQYTRSNQCNGHGNPDSQGHCTCDPKYAGSNCEYSRADNCSNNGMPQDNGTCVCDSGFFGTTCRYTRDNQCNAHGNPDNQGHCTCDPKYAGTSCLLSREGNCSNNGMPQDNGTCVCDSGFFGTTCRYTRSDCKNHGMPNDNGVCTCDPNYAGDKCQFSRSDCSNNGMPNDNGVCQCDSLLQAGQGYAFTGSHCENVIGPVQWANPPSFHADMPLGLTIPAQDWHEKAPVVANRGMNTWVYTPDQKLCLVSTNNPGQTSGWCLGYDAATNGSPLYITQTGAKTFAWDYAHGGPIMPTEKNTTNPWADDSFSFNVGNHVFGDELIPGQTDSPVILTQNAGNNPLQFGGMLNSFYNGQNKGMPAPSQFVNKVPTCPPGFMGLACDQKTPFSAIRNGDDVAFRLVSMSNGRALTYPCKDGDAGCDQWSSSSYTAWSDDNSSISKAFAFKFKPNYADQSMVANGWPAYKLVDGRNYYADMALDHYGGMEAQPNGKSWAMGLGPVAPYKANGYTDIAWAGVKIFPLQGYEQQGLCLIQHLNAATPQGARFLGLGAGTVDGGRRVVEGYFHHMVPDDPTDNSITLATVMAEAGTSELSEILRLVWKLVPVKPGENQA